MGAYTYDLEAAARRTNAYVDFLMTAYDVDLHGLADLAGIPRQTLTKFYNAPGLKKSMGTLMTLARLSDISISWLFDEKPVDEEVS